jgi:hypothetical protein
MDIPSSNWAIEGWAVSMGYTTGCSGMGMMIATYSNTGVRHHIAFVNNIAYNNASAFGVNSHGSNSGSGYGADYWAIVGNIAQNSAGRCDGYYDSAIDVIGLLQYDAATGTHIFLDSNYSYNNMQVGCSEGSTVSDGESYMLDTLDLPSPGYSQQIVFRNNIGVKSERSGLHVFYQNYNNNTPTIKIYNNTMFSCCAGVVSQGAEGEFNIQNNSPTSNFPWVVSFTNNIGKTNYTTPGGGGSSYGSVYALMIGSYVANSLTVGGSGSQNIFKGSNTTCPVYCNTIEGGVYDVTSYVSQASLGTNIYVDPAFNNLADLLNNQIGVPSCSGFTNTTACLGYNANTQTLTNPSFLYDIQPTCSQCTGKGYQLPSTTCSSSDTDFAAWLKGIVYLHWTGSAVVQNFDLVTLRCAY